MPGPLAKQDRPFLGWGQLVLPPLAVGIAFASGGCFLPLFALACSPVLAWWVCDKVAEWRYTAQWEDSFLHDEARPGDGYQNRLRGGLFALELMAIPMAILATVLLPQIWLRLPSFGHEPTHWNFNRLRVGMTAEEVGAIMGPPTEEINPATYPDPPHLQGDKSPFKKWRAEVSVVKKWHTKGRYIYYCHIDKAGRLLRKYHQDLDDW